MKLLFIFSKTSQYCSQKWSSFIWKVIIGIRSSQELTFFKLRMGFLNIYKWICRFFFDMICRNSKTLVTFLGVSTQNELGGGSKYFSLSGQHTSLAESMVRHPQITTHFAPIFSYNILTSITTFESHWKCDADICKSYMDFYT